MKNAETWRLLDTEYLDPYMNLAVEEAIPSIAFRKSSFMVPPDVESTSGALLV
jgi:hypothetical protein